MCSQQRKVSNQIALEAQCLTCGEIVKTIAVPDFETAEDIPEFVECDGWYSICRCGQHDAWSLTKLTKLMRGREKTLLNLTQAYSAGSSSSGVPLRECDFCGQNPSNHQGRDCPDKSLYKDRIEARRVRYLRAFSDGSETPVNVTDIVLAWTQNTERCISIYSACSGGWRR